MVAKPQTAHARYGLMSFQDAADYLGFKKRTIYQYVWAGKLIPVFAGALDAGEVRAFRRRMSGPVRRSVRRTYGA